MRAYTIIPIALTVNGGFVIFDEFYLKCPQTGRNIHSKTDKTLVSNYEEDSSGEIVSANKMLEFDTYKEAADFVHKEINK
jgi:hypothetical protein